jgi:hypothetical protein
VAFKSREAKVCAYGVNCKLDVSTIMAFGQLKRVGFKKKKKKKRRIQMAVEKHFSPRDPRARTNAGAAALLDGWDAADNAAEM